MAKTLKLNWGTVDLDLVTDSALSVMSWTPQVAMPRMNGEPGPVVESLTVKVSGSTHDALSTNLQSLHQMQAWARSYIEDHAGTTPVWLHAKLTNETGERRALVRAIDAQFISPWYGPMADNNPATMLALAIERDPYWEGIAALTGGAGTPSAAAAVAFDYTANGGVDIVGDVGARIGWLDMRGSASPQGRLWIGLRSSDKHGALANFVPVWECEDGDQTLGTDAARTTDTTASPGGGGNTKVTVTPGTATWAKRLTLLLSGVTTDFTDNYGKFLYLLRTKVSAGTWEIQFKFGYSSVPNASLVEGPIVQVTNTNWDYKEMGIGNIPSADPWLPAGITLTAHQFSALHIFARRTVGSGTLDLDCVCPIPVDEGFAKVEAWNSGASSDSQSYIVDSPRLGVAATGGVDNGYEMPAVMVDRFVLPPGDGRMVIVSARNGSAVVTDTIGVNNLKYYPRWASLRGGE